MLTRQDQWMYDSLPFASQQDTSPDDEERTGVLVNEEKNEVIVSVLHDTVNSDRPGQTPVNQSKKTSGCNTCTQCEKNILQSRVYMNTRSRSHTATVSESRQVS